MASLLKHACNHPGCPAIIPGGEQHCKKHARAVEQRRGSAAARGYGARWRRLRAQELQEEPLCAECLKAGVLTPATVRDHVEPHRGDPVKFWHGRRQSLCKRHHDEKTAREDGGFGR